MRELIEREFVEVVRSLGRPLCLAGPYLSGNVLEALRPERVLVDVEAWVSSTRESATAIYDRIEGCEWRHLKGLHAKLAVGPRGVLVGSANFTQGGMSRNVELGVRLSGPREAQAWFDATWEGANAFDRQDLEGYLSNRPIPAPRVSPPAFQARSRAILRDPVLPNGIWLDPDPSPALALEDESLLVGTLRRFPDREAADAYLDLLRRFYEELGIAPDDPRLSLHASREQGRTLRVNVNNRVVLTWYDRRPGFLGFTVGVEEAERLLVENDATADSFQFEAVARRPDARHMKLPRPEDLSERPRTWTALIEWARLELAYSERHPGHRRYHTGAGLLTQSAEVRRGLLDVAFPTMEGARASTSHPAATPLRGRDGEVSPS